jgi:hypothetical protein
MALYVHIAVTYSGYNFKCNIYTLFEVKTGSFYINKETV